MGGVSAAASAAHAAASAPLRPAREGFSKRTAYHAGVPTTVGETTPPGRERGDCGDSGDCGNCGDCGDCGDCAARRRRARRRRVGGGGAYDVEPALDRRGVDLRGEVHATRLGGLQPAAHGVRGGAPRRSARASSRAARTASARRRDVSRGFRGGDLCLRAARVSAERSRRRCGARVFPKPPGARHQPRRARRAFRFRSKPLCQSLTFVARRRRRERVVQSRRQRGVRLAQTLGQRRVLHDSSAARARAPPRGDSAPAAAARGRSPRARAPGFARRRGDSRAAARERARGRRGLRRLRSAREARRDSSLVAPRRRRRRRRRRRTRRARRRLGGGAPRTPRRVRLVRVLHGHVHGVEGGRLGGDGGSLRDARARAPPPPSPSAASRRSASARARARAPPRADALVARRRRPARVPVPGRRDGGAARRDVRRKREPQPGRRQRLERGRRRRASFGRPSPAATPALARDGPTPRRGELRRGDVSAVWNGAIPGGTAPRPRRRPRAA